ncbi:hypothetical protein [Rhodococcus sp. ABRD24]|uniref:hypothetical protein n=1 Tax=Rhodococcus sp. ABRD24 TaxID=2507582 RepID=UPI001F61B58D|nr:hypothetical protein [Rhodococcus sp. ABRD24]
MRTSQRIASAAAAGLMGAAMAVAAPGVASAADPCQLGWSNVGPRTCAMTDVGMAPVWTLGNGVCAGMLSVSGNAFDGPLWEYSSAPGAVHSVELRISQGFSPLGEWASTTLACDVTAIIDWQNLDTGRSGTISRYVPAANTSTHPMLVNVETGPGRVRLTMRTDHPSIPVTTDVIVP